MKWVFTEIVRETASVVNSKNIKTFKRNFDYLIAKIANFNTRVLWCNGQHSRL